MKKVSNVFLLILMMLGVNTIWAQTPPEQTSTPAQSSATTTTTQTSTTTTTTEIQSQPKTIVITSDMGIKIPADQPMIYEYRLDTKNLRFASQADRDKYFDALRDGVVSYRFDPVSNDVYLVLNKDYIDRNKWQTSDINKYLSARATYMKQQYSTYEHPAVEK